MVTKVSKVDDVATNVAAISEEQAASSQEILATSDTMVSQAQEITRSSTHAAEDSKELSVSALKNYPIRLISLKFRRHTL